MDCRIVGLAQDMNFEDDVAQTFLVLALPDGTKIRAAIDDATAARVVNLRVRVHGSAPKDRVRAPEVAPPPEDEYRSPELADFGDGVTVFGGQDTPDESSATTTPGDLPPQEEEGEEEEEEEGADDYDVPPAPPEVEAAVAAVEAEYNEALGLTAEGKPIRQRRGKQANDKKRTRAQQQGQATPGGKRKNLFRTASGNLVAPAKTVPRNEAGFPINANGVDPDALTSGNADEDGIGSV